MGHNFEFHLLLAAVAFVANDAEARTYLGSVGSVMRFTSCYGFSVCVRLNHQLYASTNMLAVLSLHSKSLLYESIRPIEYFPIVISATRGGQTAATVVGCSGFLYGVVGYNDS
jgi:hypothetical protein